MINTVIIYDHDDETLGNFFCLCADDVEFIPDKAIAELNVIKLNSDDVTVANLSTHMVKYNQERFIFLGFMHGSKEAMVLSGTENIVTLTTNHYLFSNAFIYNFSCYNGTDLADVLLQNNALVFWGYSDKAWVCYACLDEFKKCALSGLSHFLTGINVESSHRLMIEDINETIDKLYASNMFAASTLLENRDAIIVKGDKTLTYFDLLYY
ncbi:hypothetical protein [Bacteroides sp. 51]|uniref:hypothetical protein n=1 Tax=Bacteroides sp. 51 TaxID=2302938 RepID=UPI0013D13631|nr:hypothetical protein [Bacteroides sp. 51]NDV82539.1 hypothetical protein [Bacteroides sp. 51]